MVIVHVIGVHKLAHAQIKERCVILVMDGDQGNSVSDQFCFYQYQVDSLASLMFLLVAILALAPFLFIVLLQ